MSSTPPKLVRNLSTPEEALQLNASLFSGPVQSSAQSPIDDFYTHLRSLVLIGTSDALAQHSALGRVLLLGIVSATEYYFRSVLSGLVDICPLARTQAYGETLSLGSVDYYPRKDLGFALLENHSFSSAKELKSQTLRFVQFDWQDTSSLAIAIREYNRLCHLRHAATHSRGNLASRNFYEVQFSSASQRISVSVGFDAFQDAASICQNVVRAYNRTIYERTLERWIKYGKLSGKWNKDRKLFEGLFRLFQSEQDFPDQTVRQSHDAIKEVLTFRAAAARSRA